MASKNSNKISIKPMNNAAVIASTLGISAEIKPPDERLLQETGGAADGSQMSSDSRQSTAKSLPKSAKSENQIQTASEKASVAGENREVSATTSEIAPKVRQVMFNSPVVASQPLEMPLLIAIKRRFPGKELFILSLLYLQKNNRGLVQMTVSSMMALYSNVFQDVIKDDTARRSLKRLFDAGCIKTTSIPGNNSGYIYEVGELFNTEILSAAEKEDFAELTEFVKSRLNNLVAV